MACLLTQQKCCKDEKSSANDAGVLLASGLGVEVLYIADGGGGGGGYPQNGGGGGGASAWD